MMLLCALLIFPFVYSQSNFTTTLASAAASVAARVTPIVQIQPTVTQNAPQESTVFTAPPRIQPAAGNTGIDGTAATPTSNAQPAKVPWLSIALGVGIPAAFIVIVAILAWAYNKYKESKTNTKIVFANSSAPNQKDAESPKQPENNQTVSYTNPSQINETYSQQMMYSSNNHQNDNNRSSFPYQSNAIPSRGPIPHKLSTPLPAVYQYRQSQTTQNFNSGNYVDSNVGSQYSNGNSSNQYQQRLNRY